MGFSCLIHSGREDVCRKVQELTAGEGVRYAFECVGIAPALENCLDSVNASGKVVTVGNPAGDIALGQEKYWNILRKELTVLGTWNSSYSGKNHDWKKALRAMQSGAVDVKPLITHRFLLKDHEKAFQAIREKKETVVKVLFVNEERQEKNEGSGS